MQEALSDLRVKKKAESGAIHAWDRLMRLKIDLPMF
jgi:hypothetical protein